MRCRTWERLTAPEEDRFVPFQLRLFFVFENLNIFRLPKVLKGAITSRLKLPERWAFPWQRERTRDSREKGQRSQEEGRLVGFIGHILRPRARTHSAKLWHFKDALLVWICFHMESLFFPPKKRF